jgi:DNA polymerase III subunit epsilon
MRQIVFDTETTGLEHTAGHRIIEIGCVEIVNRRPTGRKFHRYVNPEREIDAGALAVHGISLEQLKNAPRFAEIVEELLEFISGAELIIHNAPFDVGFVDAELSRLPGEPRTLAKLCRVLDTLALARTLHPGQRNSLDALCKRYSAVLDAGILVDVYLAMTGGQSALALDVGAARGTSMDVEAGVITVRPAGLLLVVPAADADEQRQHEAMLDLIHKSSGGKTLWRAVPSPETPHR